MVTAFSDTLAWSLSGFGSASVWAVLRAVLTSMPVLSTVATSVSVAEASTARSPTVHVPLGWS